MALSMNLGAEDKKKLYLLGGLLGVLGVLAAIVVVLPRLGGGSTADAVANSTLANSALANSALANSALASGSPSGTLPANGANFGTARTVSAPPTSSGSAAGSTGGSPTDQILNPQLIGVGRGRDPFSSEFVPALAPTPVPTPTVRTTTTMETLPPLSISPYQLSLETTTVSLPSGAGPSVATSADGTGSSDSRILAFLPPAAIFGNTARIAPRPIPDIGGINVAAPGAQANLVSDDDKRVAGVIIGDSIRALIEYRENGQTVSRVVQPGDSVGGMEILSIGRVSEGGEQLVRVTVRENGQEKYFDLKSR